MAREKKTIVVNKRDEVIGYKSRGELDKSDIYRVSALWLTNSRGEVLLAQRAFSKSHDPGKWGPAVAGTVDEGETYRDNIVKETEEEIGLTIIKAKLKLGPKLEVNNKYHYFCQWFTIEIDKPAADFKIQRDEVASVKWFSQAELAKELKFHPEKFLNSMKVHFERFSVK